MAMPVAGDRARRSATLPLGFRLAAIARPAQRCFELALDHRLNEFAHPLAQTGFDRIKPIVEKMYRCLGWQLQSRRLRAIVAHGAVSTGAQTPGSFGFQHPETTPP